jgi:cyclic pyranopterin phosphate synthase
VTLRNPLTDPYGRCIKSLRISLTQRCDFKCFFCHREGENNPGNEMNPDEIEKIVKIASELGINKIKLTGGEPLIRSDLFEIIKKISPHVKEVSMTTNASMLKEKASNLKIAGLKRINISLHSLNQDSFRTITRVQTEPDIEAGIKAALDSGLKPVKLNTVVIKDLNSHEIMDHIEFAKKMGAILQLIEFQALENGVELFKKYHYDLFPIEEKLSNLSHYIIEREMHHRKQYHLKEGGIVEVVRPMHNSQFCAYCTRLRVTSDGSLKPCLMRNDNLIPLVDLIRNGNSKKTLFEAFNKAVACREPFWRD